MNDRIEVAETNLAAARAANDAAQSRLAEARQRLADAEAELPTLDAERFANPCPETERKCMEHRIGTLPAAEAYLRQAEAVATDTASALAAAEHGVPAARHHVHDSQHTYPAFKSVIASHAEPMAGAIRTVAQALAACRVEADRQNAAHEQSVMLAEKSGEPVAVDPADEDLIVGILRARLIELGITPDDLESFARFAAAVALPGDCERAEVGPIAFRALNERRHQDVLAQREQEEFDAKVRARDEAKQARLDDMAVWQVEIDRLDSLAHKDAPMMGEGRDDRNLSRARALHHVWGRVAAFEKRFGERPQLSEPIEPCHAHVPPPPPLVHMVKDANGVSFRE